MKKALLFSMLAAASFTVKAQVVTTISGTGEAGYSATNLTSIENAQYFTPYMTVMDSKGNMWVSDQGNNFIIMLDKNAGKYRIRAGEVNGGYADGSGPNNNRFAYPGGMAIGANDTLFIADYDNHAIRRMNPFVTAGTSQMVTTIAGGGPFTGNQGTEGYVNAKGLNARFRGPANIAVSPDKTYLLVTDKENHVIRKLSVSGSTYGEVTLFAGQPGEAGNLDGSYLNAMFNYPEGIFFDETGVIFVVDQLGGVRKLSNGTVTTIVESSKIDAGTTAAYKYPYLYISNGCNIQRYNTLADTVTLFAGQQNFLDSACGYIDATGKSARFDDIASITLSTDKTYLLVTERGNSTIRKVSLPGSTVGINQTSKVEDIYNVFPNPAKGYFMLQAKNEDAFGLTTVRLFDVTGKQILEKQIQFNGAPQRIETGDAKAGLYILKTNTANGATHTAQIIISE